MNAQLHYLRISPKIIIEKYLNDNSNLSESITDYKFFCFKGKPECILIVSNRNAASYSYHLNLYDMNWNSMDNCLTKDVGNMIIPAPLSLKKMIEACYVLAHDIPFVRIDFYEIDGKPIFGEFTFTTGYGYFTSEFYDYLGSKIDLTALKKIKVKIHAKKN